MAEEKEEEGEEEGERLLMEFQQSFHGLSLNNNMGCEWPNKFCGEEKDAQGLINDDMVMEILLHLPLQSVFKFKEVCKDWRRIISHPYFARSYRSRHGPPALSGFFNHLRGGGLTFLPISRSFQSPLGVPFMRFLRKSEPSYIAHCDGLFLLVSIDRKNFVCDPVTGTSFKFSGPFSEHRFYHAAGIVYEEPHLKAVFAFKMIQGEAPLALEIQEVQIDGVPMAIEHLDQSLADSLPALQSSTDVLQLDTFSSETNEWSTSTVKLPRPVCFNPFSRIALAIDQTIHWLLIDGGVATYNVRLGDAGLLEAPPGGDQKKDAITLHRGPGASLRYCRSRTSEVEIWMRSNIMGEKRWYMEHKVSLQDTVHGPPQVLYMCVEQGAIFVLSKDEIARFGIHDGEVKATYELDDGGEQLGKLIPYVVPAWPSQIAGSKTKPPSKRPKRTRGPQISIKYGII